jgi:hypothetical protein
MNAGQTGNFNLDTLGHTNPQHNLGAQAITQDGAVFRYVKYLDGETAVTAAAGVGVFGIQENRWHVTRDLNSTTTDVNTILGKHKGYLQAVIGDGKYGWIQTKGANRKAMTLATATTVASSWLVAVQAGNGTVDLMAALTTADTDTRQLITGKLERAAVTSTTAVAIGKIIIDCESQW